MALHEISLEVQERIAAAVNQYRSALFKASFRYHQARGAANAEAQAAIRAAGQRFTNERDSIERAFHDAMNQIDQIVQAAEDEKWRDQAARVVDYVNDRLEKLRVSAP
jgi:hypothetical protein